MEELTATLKRYRAFVAGLTKFSDEVASELALSAAQKVNSRIVDKGEDAKGGKLKNKKSGKDYSDAEIPVSVFVDAGMLTASQARQLPIRSTYKDAKKAIGRYRGHRDLMLTGAMWKNTGLTAKQVTKGGFVATVQGKTSETQMKLDRNSEQAGEDILAMSEAEVEELAEELDDELQAYMDSHGL